MTSASTSKFVDGGIPREVLDQIFSYLCGEHQQSLYSFSIASKNSHSAALPFLFRNVQIRLETCEKSYENVDTWVQILSRHGIESNVRRITIEGRLELPNTLFNPSMADAVQQMYDSLWAFVSKLIRRLPQITDFDYNCDDPFPLQLLDCLNTHPTAQCQIHLKSWHLHPAQLTLLERFVERRKARALVQASGLPPDVCDRLHTINLTYPWALIRSCSEGCTPDTVQETVQRLVAGEPPVVKKVFLHRTKGRITRFDLQRCQRGYHAQESNLDELLPLGDSDDGRPENPGRLDEFGITGVGDSLKMLRDLKLWNLYIDFSCLRLLQLTGAVVNKQVLEWATGNLDLRNLQSLQIRLDHDHNSFLDPGLSSAAVAFFDGLPPLQSIEISGRVDSALLNAVCLNHGSSLRKLAVKLSAPQSSWVLTQFAAEKADVLQMHMYCTALEELDIPIRRSKSNKEEAGIYLILGKMGKLRRLTLQLECSILSLFDGNNAPPIDPSYDEFEREAFGASSFSQGLKKGHIRDVFLNSALDENLARSIWSTIRGSNAKVKASNCLLQRLDIFTSGGADFESYPHENQITTIVAHLSRRFSISERLLVDGGGILVEEEGKALREETQMQDRVREKKLRRRWGEENRPEIDIFHRIWPAKKGSFDWRDDWESVPLDDKFLFEKWAPSF